MKWTGNFEIVSFYTPDYERYAVDLQDSIQTYLPHTPFDLVPMQDMAWEEATCYKGEFMRKKLQRTTRGVLWIDADALVCAPFHMPDVDFAIFARFADRLRAGWSPFRTGTVYLHGKGGMELAKLWEAYCKKQLDGIDQWALFDAWRDLQHRKGVMPSTYFLPRDFCRKVNENGPVKIQHLMASRTRRRKS